jgi:hypothetical protein
LISAIPALRRLRQEVQKFEASLRYIKSKKKKEKEEEKEQEQEKEEQEEKKSTKNKILSF